MTGFKSKRAAAQAIDEVNWADHEPNGRRAAAQDKLNKAIEPHTITFHNINSDWVMRITADRRIEVNEGVEVTEAAQKVLDALQNLLKPAQPEQEPVALPCCGKYETYTQACTPRGRFLGKREALAQQEPVAWMKASDTEWSISFFEEDGYVPLYTTPQRTEQNFCSRCGKRTNDIHTCTPPQEMALEKI